MPKVRAKPSPSQASAGEPDDRAISVIEEVFDDLYIDKNSARTVYHYCSAETLLAILTSKTIRFGDATCMNDGEELAWADRQVSIGLQRLTDRDDIEDNIPAISKSFREKFEHEWRDYVSSAKAFLASFSDDGDSLSQWRAYADNGRGFSIGFNVSCFDIPACGLTVAYDPLQQQAYIIEAICKMFKRSRTDKSYIEKAFYRDIVNLYQGCTAFKNPAFSDEKEVRFVHLALLYAKEEGFLAIQTLGGFVNNKAVEEEEVKYRVSNGRLIPFIDFKFGIGGESPVKEIWMGPRCETSVEEMKTFLATIGYSGIEIKTSGSKYR